MTAQATQNKIPKLRFSGFYGEWEEKKFGKVFSFKTTNSFSRDNLNYENGKVKNIHYGDIHTKFKTHFDIKKEMVPFINSEIKLDKISSDNYCKNGDLIIADASEDYADIGKSIEITNLNNEKVLAGLHTLQARPSLGVFWTKFIGQMMKSKRIRSQIITIAQGTKVLSISTGRLSNIFINIPSINEQQKIAEFLEATDEWIENLKVQKENLESYKKGMMQKIFSQEIRFKDDKGNAFPGWEEKKLGEICKIITGKLNANAMKKDGEYRFYTCAKEFYKIDKYAFDTEALLISGNGANVGYIHYYKGKFNAYQRTYVLDDFKSDITFAKYFLDKNLSTRIEKEKKAGNTPYIVMDTLSKLNIFLPSLLEQQKIAEFLTSIDKLIESKQQQITQAEQWKRGLTQGLFV